MTGIGKFLWNLTEKTARIVFRQLYRILQKEWTMEAEDSFLQFVRFGLVGISNTAVNYMIYAVSLLILQSVGLWKNYDYLIATGIGFVLSVLWSFFWNNKYVFAVEEGRRRSVFGTLIKTYISYSFTGLFLNSILMMFWVQVAHISEYIGPIFNLLISVPINFLINKFWAFK